MEQPLVTVIVVSYNHSKYIFENLDSIKNQTYKNIQLIVGDDASSDNSVAVFEQWLQENNFAAEKNFHAKNTGLAVMLNECIAMAKGKYIKLIAADDYLHPEFLEKSVSKIESLDKEYGMLFTDTFAIDDSSQIVQDIADYNALGNIDPFIFRKELIKSNRIAGLTVLMRTDVLKETGKYHANFIAEDYFRWLKINEKYLIAYIPEKLAFYRIHEENISKTNAHRIEHEDLILQMMFDKTGEVKSKINNFTQKYYLNKENLTPDYILAYKNYPYHIKRLNFALQNKVPVFLYKFLNKLV
jgi:glycosyltransferase involved in cell wall biosynthesis